MSYTVATSDLTMKLLFLASALTAFSATEMYLGFGRIQFDIGAGWVTKDRTPPLINTDLDNNCPLVVRPLMSGQILSVGHKVRGICTPAASTSMRWKFGVWGAK